MTNSENSDVNEVQGCNVCTRLFNGPVIYQPDGDLLTCKVTSTGGHCAQDKRLILVADESYSEEKIAAA